MPRLPVSILYLAPMRALINNLEPRLSRLAHRTNLTVCKWHSDVSKNIRSNFILSPSNILLTTPESLEAFLLFHGQWAVTHFSNIRAVIVDEFHAYAGNDRGAHLMALLERLRTAYCGDFQRIALSATVGNPTELLNALSTGSRRKSAVVAVSLAYSKSIVRIRYAEKRNTFESVLHHMDTHLKTLMFADSRQSVEHIGGALNERDTHALITHSSLPTAHREYSEQTFSNTTNHSMIATSALEMGIDIGDLEHIVQINAPYSVNSYLQRLGRAGRRKNSKQTFTFICRHRFALLQATALTELHRQGYVEPIIPQRMAIHLLAQQLLSMAFSTVSYSFSQAVNNVKKAVPFSKMTSRQIDELIGYMQKTGYLMTGAQLAPGQTAKRQFGGARIRNLCTDFQTPFEYIVLHNLKNIGRLDALFVIDKKEGEFRFILGAKNWLATKIDHRRHIVFAEPVKEAFDSVWSGASIPLSLVLCQCMQRILATNLHSPYWQPSAKIEIDKLRNQYHFLSNDDIVLKQNAKKIWCLHTFAGGKANALIAQTITHQWRIPTVHSNFVIAFPNAVGVAQIQSAIAKIRRQKRPNASDTYSKELPIPLNISKFENCLPESLKRKAWSERLFDVEGAKKTMRKKVRVVGPTR